MNAIFRTSKRIIYVSVFLYAILLGIAILLVCKEGNFGALFTMVIMLPFCLNPGRYELSDTSLIVRSGGFQWGSNVIPWNSITNVSIVRNGFRIDYAKQGGKKGFYVVRRKYIDNADEMLRMVKERVRSSRPGFSSQVSKV